MTEIKSFQDLFDRFFDELDATIKAWVKSHRVLTKLEFDQLMNDTCVLFADEHKIPGLIGALKNEARMYLERLAKEVGKRHGR